MAMGIADMTAEQRAANLAKSKEAQRAKQAARKASKLRRDFDDAVYWEEMASARTEATVAKRKLRLPPWGEPVTPTVMRRWLNKLGVSVTAYYGWSGERSLEEFRERNPEWPARAWGGIVLEAVEAGILK
jgi:hypothetical protein